jgi:LemA protein
MTILYIILAVVVLVALWLVGAYNGFVTLVNRAKEAWSDIEVQMKRRYDLIPNLVETVKGYAAHESSAFENVTKARAAAMGASSMADHTQAENMLTGALKSLFAVSEAYPDLRRIRTSWRFSANCPTRKTKSRRPAASTTAP